MPPAEHGAAPPISALLQVLALQPGRERISVRDLMEAPLASAVASGAVHAAFKALMPLAGHLLA